MLLFTLVSYAFYGCVIIFQRLPAHIFLYYNATLQDSARLATTIEPSEKLVHVDYSRDASLYYASLLSPANNDQLLTRLQDDIRANLVACAARNRRQRKGDDEVSAPAAAARAVIVILDSLNVLLEQSSMPSVLRFLRQLRQDPRIGSVIVRFNASAQPVATRQLLTSESTVVALVETPASLSAYPILAKERRREVPKDMHGFVLLLRQKKVSMNENRPIQTRLKLSNCDLICFALSSM